MSSDTSDSIQRRLGETTFIETSGGILTEQLIQKLRNESCSEDAVQPKTFQHPGDSPSTTSELEAEIAEAWDDLEERWDEVSRDNELFGMDVSEARRQWILKLFEALDFDPEYQQANLSAGELEANLSHLGWPRGDSVTASPDAPETTSPILHTIRPDGENPLDDGGHQGAVGRRQSPHDELQRFLNATDDVQWSIVTDGLKLRLLRDYYHTYTRGYVEFDLENIFTNRNYDDFRALYRLCHASRFIPRGDGEEAESPVESLYQVALATGVKVGEDLQSNVVEALETLGNGFLNQEIRNALEKGGQEEAEAYYQDLLRIVYRLLFLLFAEQRGMMAERGGLYTKEYSISALRERAERNQSRDQQTDLWEGLKVTFRLVGRGVDEDELHVPAYNGGLFDDEKLEFVSGATCNNEAILKAIHNLTHVEQQGYQQRISYADLGVDEIGAVYESLLEFTPQVADTALEFDDRSISRGQFYLDDRGMERKETGSFYTDPDLVDEIIQSALEPVVEERIDNDRSVKVQEQQLLDISVCDPACGSGAFLIAANNYLGQKLAEIRSDSLYPDERTVRQARRSVAQHCIYGVDLNPMAVELAKVSLWINSAVDDKPLSFLDHRIKQGNSLIGTKPELIKQGVPVDAYETSKGRDWHKGNKIRKRVRKENTNLAEGNQQARLDHEWGADGDFVSLAQRLDQIEENQISDVNEKARIHQEIRESESFQREKIAYDAWTAAFYWPLDGSVSEYPTPNTIEQIKRIPTESAENSPPDNSKLDEFYDCTKKISEEQSFFHWSLEFPLIYQQGGFDSIIGNPPWDTLEMRESEFFAVRKPQIASADTASERKELISELEESDPNLYEEYKEELHSIESTVNFVKESGRFPLSSYGIINIYAPFAELGLKNINPLGRSGIITPTAIATGSDTQRFFQKLVEDHRLVSLYDFENKKGLFPDVHREYKFCLLTMVGESVSNKSFELAFYLTQAEDLDENERKISVTSEEIFILNPNTKTCPVFRNRADAELTIDLYRGTGVLKEENEGGNFWDIELTRVFNTSDDSNLFFTRDELEDEGYTLRENKFVKNGDEFWPLYESKLTYQYDHRYASFGDVDNPSSSGKPKEVPDEMKDDPSFQTIPRYWIKKNTCLEKETSKWNIGLRDITNPNNRRTVICSPLPQAPTVHSLNLVKGASAEQALLLMACLNSFPVDFAARQKMSSFRLGQYMVRQLPVPSPDVFNRIKLDGKSISERIQDLVLKLTYTANDLSELAEDAGFVSRPFQFTQPDGEDREKVRYELEAIMLHIYDIDRNDIDLLFDSFNKIRDDELTEYGYYRTREEIKKRFEELAPRINYVAEEDK